MMRAFAWQGPAEADRLIDVRVFAAAGIDHTTVSSATLDIAGQAPVTLTPEAQVGGYRLTGQFTLPTTPGTYKATVIVNDSPLEPVGTLRVT